MKVHVYGKPYNQACQNAIGLLKSAQIEVEFHNTDINQERKALIEQTKELQKTAGYAFKSMESSSLPIVISQDTQEVLVGYNPDDHLYNNIFKEAGVKEVDDFIQKYPEWRRKKPETT